MKKEPRFFCDNCGSEVGLDLKACHQCGRLFISIRCPACGFTGDDKAFTKGCPVCGYSAPPGKKSKPRKHKAPAGPLPLWVYILSISALLGVITLLYYVLTQ